MRLTRLAYLALVACACSGRASTATVEFTGPPGSGEPNLFATADGRVILTWFEPNGENGYTLRITEREAGEWKPPRVVAQDLSFFVNWADFPAVVELADGTWLVHWLEKVAANPYAYHVKLSWSRDRGVTWSPPDVPHQDRSPTEHGFVSMVPWKDGAALIWLDGRGMQGGEASAHPESPGDMMVRATIVTPDAQIRPDVLLDDRACECCTTSLVRTDGGIVAAYRDRSTEEIRDIAVARYDGSRWSKSTHVARDRWRIEACPVNGPQLAAVGDTVAVAWFTAANGEPRVYVAFSTDNGASFGTPVPVDDGLPRGRVDVVFDDAGESAFVIWLEVAASGGEIRGRTVRRDGSTGSSWVVGRTEEGRSSGFPRMVRVAEEILVAWTVPGPEGGIRVGVVRGEE